MSISTLEIDSPPQTQTALDYQRIEKAINYLHEHFLAQPELADVARAVHLSEFHFQRLFSRWAGISPKRFLQCLTVEHAKRQLADSKPVLEVALDSGLSSPGRLHDLFVSVEAVSPGEFKTRGAGLRILYGIHPSPFGYCLVGFTRRGMCWLSFLDKDRDKNAVDSMREHWAGADCIEDNAASGAMVRRIFSTSPDRRPDLPLNLLVMGTNFQVKVWQALLSVPAGGVATYESIGQIIGAPNSARAVGAALSQNAIAFLIPCHRIIRSTGLMGGYRWGETRKKIMLAWEQARHAAA